MLVSPTNTLFPSLVTERRERKGSLGEKRKEMKGKDEKSFRVPEFEGKEEKINFLMVSTSFLSTSFQFGRKVRRGNH